MCYQRRDPSDDDDYERDQKRSRARASLAKFQIGETVGGKAEAGKWKERGEEVGTKASPHMAELGRSGRTPPSSQGLWLL
jgi:hypothetical protein